MDKNIIEELQECIDPKNILTDQQVLAYAYDESYALSVSPELVVLPRSHQQLEKIVHWANQHALALVPSGGRTGLSGGATVSNGEIVVSLEKLNKIISFDDKAGLITVEAGITLQELQEAVAEKGWLYPVDYASKGTAQMGGAVATNAGGIRVIRYGMTRDWVAGLKAVTGSGDTFDINRNLVKDNAGYDLKNLIIGSEGTLAIVSEVTLKLIRPMPEQTTVLVAVNGLEALLAVFVLLRDKVALSAAEFFCANALAYVCDVHNLEKPFNKSYSYYLLLEFDKSALELEFLASCLKDYDVVVSQSQKQTEKLWALRELISSTINPYKPYKNDIACSLSFLAEWLIALEQGFLAVNVSMQFVWFGHLGDGNVHLNVIRPESISEDEFQVLLSQFTQVIADVTLKFSATASAEHGIGVLKKSLLPSCRSSTEINLYRQIKKVFDPKNILNPGKIFD